MAPASSTPDTSGRRVLLVGATGLVGRACLRLLAADPTIALLRVVLRRAPDPVAWLPAGLDAGLLARIEWCVGDFEHLNQHPDWFDVDEVFCALGTTIRQAGSQEAFRRVDLDYPLAVARLARAHGARHMGVVSAMGADARSRVFYNRVKGEMENGLRALGFESLTLARPSLLAGERVEFRLGEALGLKLGWLIPGPWKPVRASQVALGLCLAARQSQPGVTLLDNTHLRQARDDGRLQRP